jgi:hypothetical protein
LNFDPGVLEIAGTLAYSERRLCNERERGEARCSRRILSLSAVIFNSMPQFFSATQSSSRRNDSFARVKEAENQTTASRTTFDAEVRRLDPVAPSKNGGASQKSANLT